MILKAILYVLLHDCTEKVRLNSGVLLVVHQAMTHDFA